MTVSSEQTNITFKRAPRVREGGVAYMRLEEE